MKKKDKQPRFPNKLGEFVPPFIKSNGLTMEKFAIAHGYKGRDGVYRLIRGENSLDFENIKEFADTLGIYPSELLLNEWQKPSEEIDKPLMEKILNDCFQIYNEYKQTPDLTQWLIEYAIGIYNDIVTDKNELGLNANDNFYNDLVLRLKESKKV